MGLIEQIDQGFWNTPLLKNALKILVGSEVRLSLNALNNSDGKPSSPGALFCFSLLMA